MPLKRRDKGKGIAKDPEPKGTPKDSQSSPPKEKLLSSAMPIRSWIDMIQDEEAKSKALSTHEQVNLWMKSISKSPELMLALQSSLSQSQTPPKEISEKESPKEISKSFSKMLLFLVKARHLRSFFHNQHRKLRFGLIKPIPKIF